MKFFSYISIFLSLSSPAFEVVRENDKLSLKVDCENIPEIANSLREWTVNIQENKTCPLSKIEKTDNDLCELDITQCVPEHVAKFQGIRPEFAGPNCWNLALVMRGILPNLRNTTPDEMAFYMRPPLCRQLTNNEKKLPGDVGAIRKMSNGQSVEHHGFIYISEKIAYSKNGVTPANPYTLQTLQNVYDYYDVPDKAECQQNELTYTPNCEKSVTFFRCISMNEYLNKNPDVPAQILQTLKTVNTFEQCLESRLINGQEFSSSALNGIADTAKALTIYLQNALHEKVRSDNPEKQNKRNFLLGSLQLRLFAISLQLSKTKDDDLSFEIKRFAATVAESLTQLKEKN